MPSHSQQGVSGHTRLTEPRKNTMKRILIASNYDDELFTEAFLNTPPMDHLKAQLICDALNGIDAQGPNYYKPVNVDYTPTFFTP